MPANMTLHTTRSLYDKWNKRYDEASERINVLKEKLNQTTDPDDQMVIDGEIQELCIQANLIHQFLADTGLMVYVDEHKHQSYAGGRKE